MTNKARLPDFIIIGSMKCGTTSLHYYLSRHPQVCVSRPKELNFFLGSDQRNPSDPSWANWWRGERWYRRHFVSDRAACGEVSPAYVGQAWGDQVVRRMREMAPQLKLILLVREPMQRLRSHYLMARRDQEIEPVSFSKFSQDQHYADYVAYSHYGSQIERVLKHFPRQSLLVIESSELDRNRDITLGKIFKFLGVDPCFRCQSFSQRLLARSQRGYPSEFGESLLRSAPLRLLKKILPFSIYETISNALLRPFTIPEPSLKLPDDLEDSLREQFAAEVALARQLSGLALPSLGFKQKEVS